jgi:hypothetical protein
MAVLAWDAVGTRTFETGVDHGVLYIPNNGGVYDSGVAWNGLVSVSESPSGAEASPTYADNIKYLNLISAEEFSATLEAYTYPDEFQQFDGLSVPVPGVAIGQQARKAFALCYRTRKGNDLEGDEYGYKLHLVYGITAAPSEKAYTSVNDSPEAITFSWELSTIPAPVTGLRPTSLIVIDSTDVDAGDLAALELILYGAALVDPALPTPNEVIALFGGAVMVTPGIPTYVSGTDTLTIPGTANVTYYNNGAEIAAGATVITADAHVTVTADAGYYLDPNVDNDWYFDYIP